MAQNNPFENKVVKSKKLSKDVVVQVSVNEITKRIFVEFSTLEGKFKVQKSFQDNYNGKKEAKAFEGRFKTLKDLKKYFGLE